MKTSELISIAMILSLFVSFSYAVLKTAGEIREEVKEESLFVNKHLPTTCQPFYNDGTDRWKECMGVGIK